MFAAGIQDIIHDEMRKERDKLEENIKASEKSLDKATHSAVAKKRDDTTTSLAVSYNQWDCYEDIDELQCKIDAAKKDLAKLNDKISNHTYNDKQCNHRDQCSCSGDKSAERKIMAMTTSERLDQMSLFKEEGNTLYKQQNYKEALALYEKSLIYYEYCFNGSLEERKQADSIRILCLLNAAASFLQLKVYSKCIEYCNEVLEIDKSNTKAWFRRGRAHRLLHDFDTAKKDLNKARELVLVSNVEGVTADGDMKAIECEMRMLKRDKRQYKQDITAAMAGKAER